MALNPQQRQTIRLSASGFSAEYLGLYLLNGMGDHDQVLQHSVDSVHLHRQILTSIEIHIWEMPSSLGVFLCLL